MQHLRRGGEQCGVTPELVQHKTGDERTLILGQQRPGAVQVGKRAAPVNVGHQQTLGLCLARHTHVDDVAGMQVDFCR